VEEPLIQLKEKDGRKEEKEKEKKKKIPQENHFYLIWFEINSCCNLLEFCFSNKEKFNKSLEFALL
jgi:hypothetical protein